MTARTPLRRSDDGGPPDRDEACGICGIECGSCTCPVCPTCQSRGDSRCYIEHGLEDHDLILFGCPRCHNVADHELWDVMGADADKLFCNRCGAEVVPAEPSSLKGSHHATT